jgi:hypothetical protein
MFVDLVAGSPPVKTPWYMASSPSQTYIGGTNLIAGKSYGLDIVGDEYDQQQTGSPANLQIIATSPVTRLTGNVVDTQHTSTYIAPSGALVFASGSHAFTFGLDAYRWDAVGTPYVVLEMQRLMANIMSALVLGKAATSATSGQSGFNSFRR